MKGDTAVEWHGRMQTKGFVDDGAEVVHLLEIDVRWLAAI